MKFYDLDIQLMTQNHEPLPEYGFSRRYSRSMASSYVPSITNISFYIRIQARPQEWNLSKNDWEQLSVSVYVDKDDEDNYLVRDSAVLITRSSNCAYLHGRKAMLHNGTIVEQKWMFMESGIESRFEALLSLGDTVKHKSGGAGKITVRVHRVRTLRQCPEGMQWPQLESSADIKEVSPELDHIIGYHKSQKLSYKEEGVLVKRDNPDGKPYATMQFLYRGIPQLQKMGFLNEKSLDMRNPMDQIVAGICAMNLGVELGTSHEFAKPAEGVQPLLPLIRTAKRPLQLEDKHQINSCKALQKSAVGNLVLGDDGDLAVEHGSFDISTPLSIQCKKPKFLESESNNQVAHLISGDLGIELSSDKSDTEQLDSRPPRLLGWFIG